MSARLADGRSFEDREWKKLLDPALIRTLSCLKGQKPWRGVNEASSTISAHYSTPFEKETLATRIAPWQLAWQDLMIPCASGRHASLNRFKL